MSSTRRRASLLAMVLVTAGLALGAAPADAAECPELPCVVVTYVQTVDGVTTPVADRAPLVLGPSELRALSDEKPQLNSRKYLLRKNPASKGGKLQGRPIAQGKRIAVRDLLGKADPERVTPVTYVETPNTAGVPAVLSADDLADPDQPVDADNDGEPDTVYPFFEKLQPAVFLTASGKLGYVRPLRDLDEDTNASDYFQVTDRLDLTVHTTGELLAPTVASSAGTALDRSAKTTFTATFADEPRTRITSTTWDFGDGSVKGTKRTEPSKSYAKKGTYPVAVTVRAADGSYGRSPSLEIKVANPPKAPSSGSGGGSDLGDLSGGSTLPPYDPTPFPSDISPPSDFDEPPVEPDEISPPAPVDDGLEPVEGFVLAGAEIVPGGTPETIPGTETSTPPAAATQQSLRTRVATWTVAALAIVLLVGIGAATETPWFRHRLRHLRRRA